MTRGTYVAKLFRTSILLSLLLLLTQTEEAVNEETDSRLKHMSFMQVRLNEDSEECAFDMPFENGAPMHQAGSMSKESNTHAHPHRLTSNRTTNSSNSQHWFHYQHDHSTSRTSTPNQASNETESYKNHQASVSEESKEYVSLDNSSEFGPTENADLKMTLGRDNSLNFHTQWVRFTFMGIVLFVTILILSGPLWIICFSREEALQKRRSDPVPSGGFSPQAS